jgi:hypothetical protein
MSETKSAPSDKGKDNAGDLGASQVEEAFDEAAEKGYFGESPDDTPRENYTLKGAAQGKPTPETELGKNLPDSK